VTWEKVAGVVDTVRASAARIESCAFIGTYRGKQLGQGKKSVTLRVTFRDKAKTLRHEEVDPEIAAIMDRLKNDVGAEFRTA
jgi:phenylalanyl-tRNA synthetase beta chain